MTARLIVISGRSGSGKTAALHTLEDEGFYCIDNLPAGLLPNLVDQALQSPSQEMTQLAVCIDARNLAAQLSQLPAILVALQPKLRVDLVYLDADDATLMRRFSETRRRHPLTSQHLPNSLAQALKQERELLSPLAEMAQLRIDTRSLSLYNLRDQLREQLLARQGNDLTVEFLSFAYKRGLPVAADLVFDVRILPNPYWDQALRSQTGRDSEVVQFMEQQPQTDPLVQTLTEFLERWLPAYANNNRSYLVIAIGCTGGQHRSVYVADRLYRHFAARQPRVLISHREIH